MGLYISDPIVLPSVCPSEFSRRGINDPFVKMHCCG